MISLTGEAHRIVAAVITPGDMAIDATAGNGHDTLFLAQQVGPTGIVYAFDIQPRAIEKTIRRIQAEGFHHVVLHQTGHEDMHDVIPTDQHQKIAAIMFNLGYLPGGDKTIITHSENTRTALNQALQLLKPGGILTVISYTGHPGGEAEFDLLSETLEQLDTTCFRSHQIKATGQKSSPPCLFVIQRELLQPES